MPGCAKILVVDDSAVIRGTVKHELGSGYEYREARHGLEALQIIQAGFTPDLVLLDIEMPELDGFGTCARLYSEEFTDRFPHRTKGRVPVIFLTAQDALTARRRGYELGAVDFVSKKFVPGSLAVLVHKILHPGKRLEGIQVLLVDDSRTIRQIVANALAEVGVSVIEAVDGLEAYTILCNRLSSIDLVVTDIDMPCMNGTELCQRIRRELGLTDLPIVFFTGSDQARRIEAFQSGATDCLVKPFIKEEMIARLTTHIDKARLNSRLRQAIGQMQGHLQNQRDLLATLSHDMRSPLSGIMGFADVLFMGPNRTPAELENISLIKQSGQMLLSLVNDILTVSKQQSAPSDLELKPLALEPLVTRSVALFQGIATRKKQSITFTTTTDRTTVAGHSEALTRVFNNLLSNALKFTPEGGKVTVSLVASPPDHVAVVVSDNGIGIPPDKLVHLFDRYTRVSQSGTAGEASTGLGMSIVREFVDAHKGQISVTSRPGQTTEFRIIIPLLPIAAEPAAPGMLSGKAETPHTQLSRQLQSLRVLVADDNKVNHMLASAILANAGCTVKTSVNGRDAVSLILANPADFDVVFMDMKMPVMDGLAATRAIRAAGLAALPIIALTGNVDENDNQLCREAGMNGFLTKPFTPRALMEVIVRHCHATKALPTA